MKYKVGDKILVEDGEESFTTEVVRVGNGRMIWFIDTKGKAWWLDKDDKGLKKL